MKCCTLVFWRVVHETVLYLQSVSVQCIIIKQKEHSNLNLEMMITKKPEITINVTEYNIFFLLDI